MADKFVGCFAPQALEAFAVVVGEQKGLQVLVELFSRLVVVALPGGFFWGGVEALDLAIGPGAGGLGEAVLDAVFVAHAVEDMPPGVDLVGHIAKLCPVVGQHFGHLIRDSGQYPAQEVRRRPLRGPRLQPGEGQLSGAVDGDK